MTALIGLRRFLEKEGLEGAILFHPKNLYYFTGFTGTTAIAFVSKERAVIITDSRYTEQAKLQCPQFEVMEYQESALHTLGNIIGKELGLIAFEGNQISYEQFIKLEKALPHKTLKSFSLEPLRAVKTEAELKLLRKAAQIADEAFEELLKQLKVGMTENEARLILEMEMLKRGSSEPSFETIVASGYRSALPHGTATDKVIEEGDFVTFDFGAVYKGYHSDMTRTIVMGKASDKQKELYQLVLQAQVAGVKAVKAGMLAKDIDKISRSIIIEAGYGSNFGHGLGHGVGLDIHEVPVISFKSEERLEENMLITIEPGIYLPEKMGLRIEDSVIVKATGCEIITHTPKELIEIK